MYKFSSNYNKAEDKKALTDIIEEIRLNIIKKHIEELSEKELNYYIDKLKEKGIIK